MAQIRAAVKGLVLGAMTLVCVACGKAAIQRDYRQLNATEVCALISAEFVEERFGYPLTGLSPRHLLDGTGSRCEFDATSDGFTGDRLAVRWFVGGPSTHDPRLDVTTDQATRRTVTVTPTAVDPLTVNVTDDLEWTIAETVLADRSLAVSIYTDNPERLRKSRSAVIELIGLLAETTAALKPTPQPDPDAPAKTLASLAPSQICALIDRSTVADLLAGRAMQGESGGRTGTGVVDPDRAECSWGGATLQLTLDAFATGSIKPGSMPIGGLPAEFTSEPIETSNGRTIVLACDLPADGSNDSRRVELRLDAAADTPQVRHTMEVALGQVLTGVRSRVASAGFVARPARATS